MLPNTRREVLWTNRPSKYTDGRIISQNVAECPHRSPDAYHTLYCLSGLSAAQHRVVPSAGRKRQLLDAWKPVENGIHSRFYAISGFLPISDSVPQILRAKRQL